MLQTIKKVPNQFNETKIIVKIKMNAENITHTKLSVVYEILISAVFYVCAHA